MVRERLRRFTERASETGNTAMASGEALAAFEHALQQAQSELPSPSVLDRIEASFGLSPFERDILLLCAGVELDSELAGICALLHGDRSRGYPTFELALSAFPDAHWSALSPDGPLRKQRLIKMTAGATLTTSILAISERVLHALLGIDALDERLRTLVSLEPFPDAMALSTGSSLPGSSRAGWEGTSFTVFP